MMLRSLQLAAAARFGLQGTARRVYTNTVTRADAQGTAASPLPAVTIHTTTPDTVSSLVVANITKVAATAVSVAVIATAVVQNVKEEKGLIVNFPCEDARKHLQDDHKRLCDATIGAESVTHPLDKELCRLINSDTHFNTVVVTGAQNAGKSAAVRRALLQSSSNNSAPNGNEAKKTPRVHVMWIQANDLHSTEHLASVIEKGIGATWDSPSLGKLVLHALIPGLPHQEVSKPADPNERINVMLQGLEATVKTKTKPGDKYVVLVDDFETAVCDESQDPKLKTAMDRVISELTRMGKNSIVQPVIVSSDGHVADYINRKDRAHRKFVTVPWLTKKEAEEYVIKFAQNANSKISINEKQAAEIVQCTGRLPYHLRAVCDAVVDDGCYFKETVKTAVKELQIAQFTAIESAAEHLNDQEREEFKAALNYWKALVDKQEENERQVKLPLTGEQCPPNVRAVIRCGALYKDHKSNEIQEASILARWAMLELQKQSSNAQ